MANRAYSLQEGSRVGVLAEVKLDQSLAESLLVLDAQLELFSYPAVEEIRACELLEDGFSAIHFFFELVLDEFADVLSQGFFGRLQQFLLGLIKSQKGCVGDSEFDNDLIG